MRPCLLTQRRLPGAQLLTQTPTMNYVQPTNGDKVLLLIDASIQAYRAFDHDPRPAEAPLGYEIVDTFSGVDSVFGDHRTVEVYGIVFRSISSPDRYVFAFRGTDSVTDLIEDPRLGARPRGVE